MMNGSNAGTSGVDHVGLTVRNLDVTRRFFCDCLGWSVFGEKPDYPASFVTDGTARVTLWQTEDPETSIGFDRRRNLGLHHLALRVATLEALHALYLRISDWPDAEIEFAPEPSGGGPRIHFMIREPGGLRLEFVCHPTSG